MARDFRIFLAAISAIFVTTPAFSQETELLSTGTYRLEGKCSRTFYLGAKDLPECDHYLGIQVKDATKPMFYFPLKNDGQAWFFVTSKQEAKSDGHAIYSVEKIYDKALNAEFSYPAGECEITSGPSVRCAVWKDVKRTVLARELVFSGSGDWMHTK